MNKKKVIKEVVYKYGGVAKTADFVSEGLTNYEVSNLCNSGYIRRVRHGFYQMAEEHDASEEQLLAALLPEGIVCMESALFHYGYSDFSPRIWTVAVPRTIARTKVSIEGVPLKAYYIQEKQYMIGKTVAKFNGVKLAIYNRERTICDCFKYRTRLDNELFNKAINAYVADENKSLSNLSRYAKEMGLYKRVMNVMEVLING